MAVPPLPSAVAPADSVTVMSVEEWREAARQALKRLDLTYEQLQQQASERNFASTAARKLWMLVGGTL